MTLPFNDLRFAVRGLVRSPLFAIVAILSLALGIGANTAIFTLIDQILLRKLPVSDPGRAGDALPAGRRTTAATWARGCTRIRSTRTTSSAPSRSPRCSAGGWSPASVSIDNQTERARSRDGVGQLLHDARRASRRSAASSTRRKTIRSTRAIRSWCSSYDYWVQPLRARSRRRRQEDPRQQLPDDHRRRVGRRALPASIRRASPQIRVPILMKPVMVPEWDWLHMDDRARALGAGVRAAEAGLHRRVGAGAAAGAVHADPRARDDAARRRRTGRRTRASSS